MSYVLGGMHGDKESLVSEPPPPPPPANVSLEVPVFEEKLAGSVVTKKSSQMADHADEAEAQVAEKKKKRKKKKTHRKKQEESEHSGSLPPLQNAPPPDYATREEVQNQEIPEENYDPDVVHSNFFA